MVQFSLERLSLRESYPKHFRRRQSYATQTEERGVSAIEGSQKSVIEVTTTIVQLRPLEWTVPPEEKVTGVTTRIVR